MKKLLSTLLALSLALSLGACAVKVDPSEPDEPAKDELRIVFTEEHLTKEAEYKADDGTVLLIEKYDLPQLEVRTSADEVYTPPVSNTAVDVPQEYAAALAFNAEMQRAADALDASAQEALAMAREHYAGLDEEQRAYWTNYAEELIVDDICQFSGLVSVWGGGYSNYGGAHGWESIRAWSFDLTTGEFLTLDALSSEEGDINGDSLQTSIYQNIVSQIDSQGLSEAYFDDYDSYLSDFPAFATFYFTATGMTVAFDTYIIAPYAAGPQVFDVPYSVFYSALNERAKTLLEVPQEQIVLSDFDTAATLWSWLFITTPPTEDTPDEMEINGYTYYQADIPGVSTLADMRELMYRYFDKALADRWLEETERYAEADGRLYVLSADRGSNDSIMDETCSVALDGESGTVTQTVTYGEWDEATQSRAATGEETFAYPFTLVDGHAVFSAFPYPY